MPDPQTITAVVGAVTGIVALVLSCLNHRRLQKIKALDLRIELRKQVAEVRAVIAGLPEAIRRLASLGFVELIDDGDLRLRSSLLRFADPVRGLRDFETSLERLISKGEIVGPAGSNGAEGSPQEGPDSVTDEEEESGDRLDDDLEVDS